MNFSASIYIIPQGGFHLNWGNQLTDGLNQAILKHAYQISEEEIKRVLTNFAMNPTRPELVITEKQKRYSHSNNDSFKRH